MLLQCETQDPGEGAGLVDGWLQPGTLESLVELNELCLALLAEQAAARTAPASLLLRQVGELWRVGDAGQAAYTTFFTVPAATGVARLVFTYAWHLARSQSAAARLLLGISTPCAALIAHYSLRQIHALAETHQAWLKPRWPARVQVWRELLLAAASGEAPALERARLHGLTLLAADARGSPPERAAAGAP